MPPLPSSITPAFSIWLTLSSIILPSVCACRRLFSIIGEASPVSMWRCISRAVAGG
ncbi:hypothetical protein PR003_g23417 [Phytophthora rubi]|uniref:Uncharacterized protein n=1 Tax=Phytophthora rubi TaxID=129364 RepID=A0A6A3J6G8_9STRA|nr:hypothetical protein PR002_g21272 [Phytophthora rubi]KAE9297737.1 hypothetical protein PR003_g23417 [Phytophthora rubi]